MCPSINYSLCICFCSINLGNEICAALQRASIQSIRRGMFIFLGDLCNEKKKRSSVIEEVIINYFTNETQH